MEPTNTCDGLLRLRYEIEVYQDPFVISAKSHDLVHRQQRGKSTVVTILI